MKKIIIVHLLFCCMIKPNEQSLNTQTLLSKLYGSFGQSKPLYLLNRLLAQPLRIFDSYFNKALLDQAAPEQYQILGKEAQTALGIPLAKQVPIKILKTQPKGSKIILGIARPWAIYINSNELDKRRYGEKRTVLLHEAVHIKYNDQTTSSLFAISACLGSQSLAQYTAQKINPNLSPAVRAVHGLAAVLGASLITIIALPSFTERRADIEAFYAAQCTLCALEGSINRSSSRNPEGYLSAPEIFDIAVDLEQHTSICAYHKSPNNSEYR